MRRLGRGDGLLLAVLLILLLGAYLLFGSKGGGSLYAEISIEGELYRRIELTGHRGRESLALATARGQNVVVVEDEEIFVSEADCPDKICVRTGRLSKAGDTAACLPHKILIEVKEGPLP